MLLVYLVNLLLLFTQLQAATVTVCASGCDYSSLQTAINDAADDPTIDIVEVKAGETFAGNISLPNRHVSKHNILIRTSRWRELPLPGNRVSYTNHSSLMPKITGNVSPHGSALTAWPVGGGFTASASTDTLTECSGGYVYPSNGNRIIVKAEDGYTLPEPLQENTAYWAVNVSGGTFKLSATPGGTAINLTTDGSGGCKLIHGTIDPPSNYTLRGIWFQASSDEHNGNLLWLGYGNRIPNIGINNITISQCIIRGDPNELTESNQNGITAIGNSLTVEDSFIDHFKYTATESHAISLIGHGFGPFIIRNNFLSAASIGILVGGASEKNILHNHVIDKVIIQGNHVYKHGYYSYHSGAGAPSGTCAPAGRFYRNTTPSPNTCANGACYICQEDGTWLQDTGATYRDGHLLNKGGIEFKGCKNCVVEGNIVENTFDAYDTGNVSCIVPVAGQNWQEILDVTIKNNYCLNAFAGIAVATANGNNTGQRITVQNNVLVNQGDCDRSIYSCPPGGAATWSLRVDGGRKGVKVLNNTVRLSGEYRNMDFAMTGPNVIDNFLLANNVIEEAVYPLFMDGSDNTCSGTGIQKYIDTSGGEPYPIRNNVIFGTRSGSPPYSSCTTNTSFPDSVSFVSTTNHRLTSGGPYSADCITDCLFTGTDGKDLGADVDEWENVTSGVLTGAQPWSVQANLQHWTEQGLVDNPAAFQIGSTKSSIIFKKYNATCSFYLYTNSSRTTLHGDTDTSGEQSCSRTGNIVSSNDIVSFVLGTNTALTANTTYYYKIVDGTRIIVGSFKTKATGSGATTFTFGFATPRTLEYSANADMSSSTTLSSSTSHIVPINQGAIVYVRPAGGNIKVLVNN